MRQVKDPDQDSYLLLMDPTMDPGGPKTWIPKLAKKYTMHRTENELKFEYKYNLYTAHGIKQKNIK